MVACCRNGYSFWFRWFRCVRVFSMHVYCFVQISTFQPPACARLGQVSLQCKTIDQKKETSQQFNQAGSSWTTQRVSQTARQRLSSFLFHRAHRLFKVFHFTLAQIKSTCDGGKSTRMCGEEALEKHCYYRALCVQTTTRWSFRKISFLPPRTGSSSRLWLIERQNGRNYAPEQATKLPRIQIF